MLNFEFFVKNRKQKNAFSANFALFNFQAITWFEDMHFFGGKILNYILQKMQGRLRIQSETTQGFAKSAV